MTKLKTIAKTNPDGRSGSDKISLDPGSEDQQKINQFNSCESFAIRIENKLNCVVITLHLSRFVAESKA